ncbi:hypothetical protein KXR94_20420 [Stutzerimonas stutzeri]
METWFRKFLGYGSDVYLTLRHIREDRFRLDPHVTTERAFLVVEHLDTAEAHLYLPPGNELLAQHCGAVPCPPLKLDRKKRVLSIEDIPAVPPLLVSLEY